MIKTAKLILIKRMTCIANISFKMNGGKTTNGNMPKLKMINQIMFFFCKKHHLRKEKKTRSKRLTNK